MTRGESYVGITPQQQNVLRFGRLLERMRGAGSYGLVLLDSQGTYNLQEGLSRGTQGRTLFLQASGNVQGHRKSARSARTTVDMMKRFEERHGDDAKDSLYAIHGYDFGKEDEGGTPAVREYLEARINLAKSPMTLLFGKGSTEDMKSIMPAEEEPAEPIAASKTGLIRQLGGVAALYKGFVVFDIPHPIQRPSIGQLGDHAPVEPEPEAQLPHIAGGLTIEVPQGYTRL